MTFGWSLRGEDTYASQLASLLATLRPNQRVEVINAGVSAWGSDQALLWYRNEGAKYEPDLVILGFFPGNDFLIRELRAWTLQQSLQTLQKNFPSCWGEAQLGDYGRLGVPRDGTRQVFYLEREELSQNTPPFPLVCYSLRSLNPGEFMEGASRAYLAVLER